MTFILFIYGLISLLGFLFYNTTIIKDTIYQFSNKQKNQAGINTINNNKNKNNMNKIIKTTDIIKKESIPQINYININPINKNNDIIMNKNEQDRKNILNIKNKRNIKNEANIIRENIINDSGNVLNIINNKNTNKIQEKIENVFNEIEMNELIYETAKKKDKRTYSQYYLSLLRTRHFLISTFFNNNDYNSKFIKIYIFFYTFAINYVISAMFYSDNTMHKILIDEGSFDFTYQLPQMIYSLIISSILKTILNYLGLYGKNIIDFKNIENKEINIEKFLWNIKIKIIIFFIITYILLFFLWIYLGCFCAVYENTQIHLLLDVSLSFGISFITPFFKYLLPGMFRIPSLKDKTERRLMLKFSKFLQIL